MYTKKNYKTVTTAPLWPYFQRVILCPQLAALSQHALGLNITPNKHSSFLHWVTFCEIVRLYILHSSVPVWTRPLIRGNKRENTSCSNAFLAFNTASHQHDLSSCIMSLANGWVVQIWSFYLSKSTASLIWLVIWPCLSITLTSFDLETGLTGM